MPRSVLRGLYGTHTRFLRRMFAKPEDVLPEDFGTWENTLRAMSDLDMTELFAKNMETFEHFLETPSRENFAAWRTAIEDDMEERGVYDDWNMSKLFFAILTQRYDELGIVDETQPIELYTHADEVSDAGGFDHIVDGPLDVFLTAKAFATIVCGIAECDQRPDVTAEHVAEELMNEAEERLEEGGEDEEEDE